MALSAGSRIGPYEIVEAIGAGGMGEVYRARDGKLARDVAIKVLPAEFALDADRRARFTREAQVLASLNHQNIAGIYGFEENALVLEFVDGPTLADRIAQGPIPVDDALPIARQIAEALEAAHEQGIIHRDLKPANIKVRPEGTVKVLDFGLAKLAQAPGPAPAGSKDPAYTVSPTITTPALTQVGVILGTAAYMSPEQAKGREADKRSDVWAFGCVLYEMLTGKRLFAGDDVSDTLAFVLTKQLDFDALPTTTPRAIRRLLRRCLEKDRKRRLADAADARLEIDDALAATGRDDVHGPRAVRPPLWRSIVVASSALVVGGLIVGLWLWNRKPAAAPQAITRFVIPLADGQRFLESGSRPLAISPDGARYVFAADRRLYIRSMSTFESKPIPGTDVPVGQLSAPVFSPDGQSIAYVSGRPASIKRIAVTGGAPLTICDGCGTLGAMSWDSQGIVFAQGGGPGLPVAYAGERSTQGSTRIMRVPADGGEPQLLFNVSNDMPWDVQSLPGGKAILFGLVAQDPRRAIERADVADQVVVQLLESGQRKVVIANGASPRYLPTGHIVYTREGILFAKRFDLAQLEATGEEVPIVEGVRRPSFVGGASTRSAYFDVSDSGSLVYVPGPLTLTRRFDLGSLDPHTGVTPLKVLPNTYDFPRVSPDGKWIAVEVDDGKLASVWVYERSGASAIRQLASSGSNHDPIWSPDSLSVAFRSDRENDFSIWSQRADGSRAAERLTKSDPGTRHIPDAWSPDGRTLVFEILKDNQRTLWALSVGDKNITQVGDIRGAYSLDATFSPNGKWLAYRSVINGASGVTVEPFPPTGASRYPIENGVHPVFARDGKTLFFRRLTSGEFLATPVTTDGGFTFSKPQELPMTFADRMSNSARRTHDITPDGKFIGLVEPASEESSGSNRQQINVVLNWFEELKQKLPQ